jgi:hypothetical protein
MILPFFEKLEEKKLDNTKKIRKANFLFSLLAMLPTKFTNYYTNNVFAIRNVYGYCRNNNCMRPGLISKPLQKLQIKVKPLKIGRQYLASARLIRVKV